MKNFLKSIREYKNLTNREKYDILCNFCKNYIEYIKTTIIQKEELIEKNKELDLLKKEREFYNQRVAE